MHGLKRAEAAGKAGPPLTRLVNHRVLSSGRRERDFRPSTIPMSTVGTRCAGRVAVKHEAHVGAESLARDDIGNWNGHTETAWTRPGEIGTPDEVISMLTSLTLFRWLVAGLLVCVCIGIVARVTVKDWVMLKRVEVFGAAR